MQNIGFRSDVLKAREYYLQAYQGTGNAGYLIRAAILQPMIIASREEMLEQRAALEANINALLVQSIT